MTLYRVNRCFSAAMCAAAVILLPLTFFDVHTHGGRPAADLDELARKIQAHAPDFRNCGIHGDAASLTVARAVLAIEAYSRGVGERIVEEQLIGRIPDLGRMFADVSIGESQITIRAAVATPLAAGMEVREIAARLVWDRCWGYRVAAWLVGGEVERCGTAAAFIICAQRAAARYNGQKSVNSHNLAYLLVFGTVYALLAGETASYQMTSPQRKQAP